VGYAFSEATKSAKKTILHCKMEIVCIFSFPSNEYLYSWCKLVGYAFSGATKYAKKQFYSVKWRLLAYSPFPRNGYLFWGKLWDMYFLEPPKCKTNPFDTVKLFFLYIFHFPEMDISTPGASLWDMHFLEPPNMQKNSILHCKMEIFCIFSISQKWKPAQKLQESMIFKNICKKSPFYSVKCIFFES